MTHLFRHKPLTAIAAAIAAIFGTNAQDGSVAYQYLNTTSSARIYALGGVNITAVSDDLSTSDQNPALLGAEVSGQVMVDYMRYLGSSNFAGVRYGHSSGERGAWSAGIRYYG
ncbi:MAG: hypothetical protein K2O10_07935, partial [Muribaculaceae bacterium]|nr:hypothetical protein [Muribaculaceae bacterium]